MAKKSFFDTTKQIRQGGFLDECSEALHTVVEAVERDSKPAKLLIEITVKPASKQAGTVMLLDKVTTKLPPVPAGESYMFVTPEGNLQSDNPKQEKLDLKAVPVQPEQELKQISA